MAGMSIGMSMPGGMPGMSQPGTGGMPGMTASGMMPMQGFGAMPSMAGAGGMPSQQQQGMPPGMQMMPGQQQTQLQQQQPQQLQQQPHLLQQPPRLQQQGPAVGQQMTAGTVRKWMPEKGFGFITPVDGGADVFVHNSSFAKGAQLIEGQQVVFQLTQDPRNGKPRAEQVSGPAVQMPGAAQGMPAMPGMSMPGMPMGGMPMGGMPMPGMSGMPTMPSMPGMTGMAGMPGMQMGVANGGASAPTDSQGRGGRGSCMELIGQTIQGTVREWLDDKGYGFITPSMREGSIFVHHSAVGGGPLKAGTQVQCSVVPDQRSGKPRAENVVPLGGGAVTGAPGMPSPMDPAAMQQQQLMMMMMAQQQMLQAGGGHMPQQNLWPNSSAAAPQPQFGAQPGGALSRPQPPAENAWQGHMPARV